MSSKWPVPRPTEHAALRALDLCPRELPTLPGLFAGLVVATVTRDRRGANLIGHLIARVGGEVSE